jgi:hypothetical protein
MNKDKIKELMKQAGTDTSGKWMGVEHAEKLIEALVVEFIDILQTEIDLVKKHQIGACNEFDVRWHQGKIDHFEKLLGKSKNHFGVNK